MPRNKYKDLEYADKTTEEFLQAVEELVDVVRSTPDNKTYGSGDELENFITDVGLKAGTQLVMAFLIYYEYLLWAEGLEEDENNTVLYTYEEFFYRFSKKYKPKKTNTGASYKLNKDVFGKYKIKTKEELASIKERALQHRKTSIDEKIVSDQNGQEDVF